MNINLVKAKQCVIPYTTPNNYITGIYALNVAADDGTSADWHDVYHWRDGIDKPRTVAVAGITVRDSNYIFGNYGVSESKHRLERIGIDTGGVKEVYIANHIRAVLDMLFDSLCECNEIYNLTGAVGDWFDKESDRNELISKCNMLTNVLSGENKSALTRWLLKEKARLTD
jgi:hypothetical protein